MNKKTIKISGIIFIIVGVILSICSFISLLGNSNSVINIESPDLMNPSFTGGNIYVVLFSFSFLLIVIGGVLLYFILNGKLDTYITSKEVSNENSNQIVNKGLPKEVKEILKSS